MIEALQQALATAGRGLMPTGEAPCMVLRCARAQGNTLGARLVLLSLHFPRLRLLWSRSLHATADLFKALKGNQDEPDSLAAAGVGRALVSVTPVLHVCSRKDTLCNLHPGARR